MVFFVRNVLLGGSLLLLLYPAAQVLAQEQPPTEQVAKPTAADLEQLPDTSDGQFSIALFDWLGGAHPTMRTGHTSTQTNPSNLVFPGSNSMTPGFVMSLPVGGQHTLRLSYFRTQGQGNLTAPTDLSFFGTDYVAGDYLSAGYTLQNYKASLDYLSWPFPIRNARFRVKTLWEVQVTSIKSGFNAPFAPVADSAGNLLQTWAEGTNWFIYPTLGMGVEGFLSKHFRWEAKASGFAIPGYSTVWDAEAMAAYRHGQFEIVFGEKGFHFKTSPRREEYVRSTISGAFLGIRWYPR